MSNKLTDFKALLFDVDKTLTNTSRMVSQPTKEALAAVQNRGFMTAVCTGRHYSVLQKDILPLFKPDQLHITCGGGQVITSTGEVVWEQVVPATVSQEIFSQAEAAGCGFSLPQGDRLYVNQQMEKNYKNKEHLAGIMADITMLPVWSSPVLIITETTPDFEAFLSGIPEITVKKGTSSIGTPYVDVTAKGVTKKRGLEEWCALNQINQTEIIGFGDGENDEEFLREVGYSVALGNAEPKIKALVKKVINHTDDDGLAVYLQSILKGEPL